MATKGTDKAFANIDTEVTSSDFGVVGNMPGVQEDNNFITTYVLWEEIVETSSAQSRGVTYDPEQHPKDAELHDSIKKHGVKTPIIVFRLDDGGIFAGQGERRFRLQAGHRRMEAAKDAGVKGALAVVNTSDDDGDLNTLIENVGRRDLTDYEMAHALRSIMQARGLSEIQEVIEITGLLETACIRPYEPTSLPISFVIGGLPEPSAHEPLSSCGRSGSKSVPRWTTWTKSSRRSRFQKRVPGGR